MKKDTLFETTLGSYIAHMTMNILTPLSEQTMQDLIKLTEANTKTARAIMARSNKKAPTEDNVIFTACKERWMAVYREKFKTEYYFLPGEIRPLKELAGKIKFKLKEANLPYETGDVADNLGVFLTKIESKFVMTNFTIRLINSKFNEVYAEMKNSKGSAKLAGAVELRNSLHDSIDNEKNKGNG